MIYKQNVEVPRTVKVVEHYHAPAPFQHRSRGKLKCDHCGDEADHQHWFKDEGLICNQCETDLYRIYCGECGTYVEIEDPCEHRKDNADEGDDDPEDFENDNEQP